MQFLSIAESKLIDQEYKDLAFGYFKSQIIPLINETNIYYHNTPQIIIHTVLLFFFMRDEDFDVSGYEFI